MMASDAPPLSRFQRVLLRVFGSVRVGWLRGPGWSGWLEAYAFECGRHGVVVAYGEGFEGRLVCPLCAAEGSG